MMTALPRTGAREQGFSLIELMIATTIMLLVVGATLQTFKQAVDINDTAGQLADSNQNLRAGTNQLVRDLMMAGRIIADGGVPVPNGTGALAINRPGPPGTALTFSFMADENGTTVLPSITTGYHLGPTINTSTTDVVTILTVDEFMPWMTGIGSGTPTGAQAFIQNDGSQLTLPATSTWLVGDTTNDTQPIQVGDLILFKNNFGMSIQTVTSMDSTHIVFGANNSNDWFNFNQRSTALAGTIFCVKADAACDALPVTSAVQSAAFPTTALFRLQMITYYVDNTTTPGTPRLTRVLNHCPGSGGTNPSTCTSYPSFAPQALAGVVEDMDLTYDLVDTTSDVLTAQPTLPVTSNGLTYTSNMIKNVNIHVGVRSETISNPTRDYVRNHISTAVAVRSLSGVDRYDNVVQ